MRKLLLFIPFLFSVLIVNAQRHVLLEEFTGAYCGNCPMGSYYIDSMQAVYPTLIPISLHSYGVYDAMNFPQIDTLDAAYSAGAPLAGIDRICHGPTSDNTAQYITFWDNNIQQRLAVAPQLDVNVIPTWTSATRIISAQVDVNILSNMDTGDYRIGLYVMEDSVTGIGAAYDQENFYDTQAGNPFYGMGNPIVGYVHRHVARAILPSSWGLAGVIPASPTTGQNFTTTFNYTLPASYNENHVHLIAFVYSFTSNHAGDEVMNANEAKLIPAFMGINTVAKTNALSIYPNPVYNRLIVSFPEILSSDSQAKIYNSEGEEVLQQNIAANARLMSIDVSQLSAGIYFLTITNQDQHFQGQRILITR